PYQLHSEPYKTLPVHGSLSEYGPRAPCHWRDSDLPHETQSSGGWWHPWHSRSIVCSPSSARSSPSHRLRLLDGTLELFLNKITRGSTAQHKRQEHHPQSQLCDCGRHAPKWCSVSCRPWPAQ